MDGLTFLQSEQFKTRLKSGGVPQDDGFGLVKSFSPEVKKVDEAARTAEFVISTEAVDRHGDVVTQKGWKLKNFKKNPVVLWAHSHRDPPIAKAISTKVEDKQLVSTAEFIDGEISGFADMIFRMVQGKFLKATSVGFIPLEWEWAEDAEDRGWLAMDITKQELLEWSVVPVPANQDTLLRSIKAGIDVGPWVKWCEQTLDTWEQREGILMPRKTIEALREMANEKQPVHHLSPSEQDALRQRNLDAVKGEIDFAYPVEAFSIIQDDVSQDGAGDGDDTDATEASTDGEDAEDGEASTDTVTDDTVEVDADDADAEQSSDDTEAESDPVEASLTAAITSEAFLTVVTNIIDEAIDNALAKVALDAASGEVNVKSATDLLAQLETNIEAIKATHESDGTINTDDLKATIAEMANSTVQTADDTTSSDKDHDDNVALDFNPEQIGEMITAAVEKSMGSVLGKVA